MDEKEVSKTKPTNFSKQSNKGTSKPLKEKPSIDKKSKERSKEKPIKQKGRKSGAVKAKKVKLELEEKKEILYKVISRNYWNLYLDIFLLFALSIAYGVVLFYTDLYLGIIYIVFAIIFCILISMTYYFELEREMNVVLKDLEGLLK